MPTECVWFAEAPEGLWEAGWCFPHAWRTSMHYRQHVALFRPAITVMVPTRDGSVTPFCIDSAPTYDPGGAWTVICPWPLVPGEKPPITVQPSINIEDCYHGWLVDGVLSDDLGS